MAVGTGGGERLAVSVHGPVGVLDLVVPSGAVAIDVAREYAEQVGLASIPCSSRDWARRSCRTWPRAELAEALCGSAAVVSVFVVSGVIHSLWASIHLHV